MFVRVAIFPMASCVIAMVYLSLSNTFFFLEKMLQLLRLIDSDQVVNKLVQFPIEHAGEIMACQADAMIGHAILWEVIGANLLTPIPGLHLGTSCLAQLFLPTRLFYVPHASLTHP